MVSVGELRRSSSSAIEIEGEEIDSPSREILVPSMREEDFPAFISSESPVDEVLASSAESDQIEETDRLRRLSIW